MRPNNRSTMINDDSWARRTTPRPAPRALGLRERHEDHRGVNVEAIDDVIPVWCVPVRFDGRVVA